MRRYMRRGMTGREKRRLLLFLVCAALIALAVTAMTQLRPILTSLATARVSNAVTRVVNTSVALGGLHARAGHPARESDRFAAARGPRAAPAHQNAVGRLVLGAL